MSLLLNPLNLPESTNNTHTLGVDIISPLSFFPFLSAISSVSSWSVSVYMERERQHRTDESTQHCADGGGLEQLAYSRAGDIHEHYTLCGAGRCREV